MRKRTDTDHLLSSGSELVTLIGASFICCFIEFFHCICKACILSAFHRWGNCRSERLFCPGCFGIGCSWWLKPMGVYWCLSTRFLRLGTAGAGAVTWWGQGWPLGFSWHFGNCCEEAALALGVLPQTQSRESQGVGIIRSGKVFPISLISWPQIMSHGHPFGGCRLSGGGGKGTSIGTNFEVSQQAVSLKGRKWWPRNSTNVCVTLKLNISHVKFLLPYTKLCFCALGPVTSHVLQNFGSSVMSFFSLIINLFLPAGICPLA